MRPRRPDLERGHMLCNRCEGGELAIELLRLHRITAVVPDPEASYTYLQALFGVRRIDDAGSSLRSDGEISVVQARLGHLVLEFVAPRTRHGEWQARLMTHGPAVVSLACTVADLGHAARSLEAEGIQALAGTHLRGVYDTAGLLGFNIELMESTGAKDAESPRLGHGGVSPLVHIEITHNDVNAAYGALHRLFGSEKVELAFAAFLVNVTAGRMNIVHVNLGDTVLQYIQPRHDAGPWWHQLQARGASVHNLTWLVEDMPAIAAASRHAGTRDLRYFEFDYSPLFGAANVLKPKTIGRIIDASSRLGFHVELSERQATNINDFMYKPL
jgi:catechol 2,3-dioxygenase-like lactoylglutathione lyase family enzyme